MNRFADLLLLVLVAIAVQTDARELPANCVTPPPPTLPDGSPGPVCLAYFPRYGYDATVNSCYRFIYGGCGRPRNNFHTEKECLDTCAEGSVQPTDATPVITIGENLPNE